MKPGDEVIMAGELKHPVRFYRKALQQDAMGGNTHVWQRVTEQLTHMKLDTPNAYETTVANQTAHQLSHIITVRYKDYVTADMAVYWPAENRVFSITGVRRVDSKKRRMQLNAMERRDMDTKGW